MSDSVFVTTYLKYMNNRNFSERINFAMKKGLYIDDVDEFANYVAITYKHQNSKLIAFSLNE